jgi:cardiolipin synthase
MKYPHHDLVGALRHMSGSLDQAGTTLLAMSHVLVACIVTGHVLLTKRDIGASIGWIGIVWLSPFLGGLFYLIFGINRVVRRARQLRPRRRGAASRPTAPDRPRDDHLSRLDRAAQHITRRPAETGNDVRLLIQGDEAYPRMLEAIAQARTSIALSSYILRADAVGEQFVAALIAAQLRGVAVRVLIDGVGSGYFNSAAYRVLHRGGVPVARFLHSLRPWRMPFLNLRLHKKILCIDGRVCFTGGLNIGAENVLAGRPLDPVRDAHFRFEGPVVAQLTETFVEDWQFTTGEELDGPAWFPNLDAAGLMTARVVTSGPDQDLEKIEMLVLQAITCARHAVAIMTPYFLPDDRLVTALALAAMRGVAIDIVLPARSNHGIFDWAVCAEIEPLLTAGCRVWRNPPPFEHSKLMTVDGTWCLVGSSNWDMRSFRLNFELNVEIYDPSLAAQIDRLIAEKRIHPVGADELARRPLPVRLRDAGARLLLPYL